MNQLKHDDDSYLLSGMAGSRACAYGTFASLSLVAVIVSTLVAGYCTLTGSQDRVWKSVQRVRLEAVALGQRAYDSMGQLVGARASQIVK
ncbi:MAG TPA: hypothetical protein V6D08_05095 [Candidatus Obscuribacterales bacterium]